MPETLLLETLLLCFIHGFKGDDETFFEFPEYLKSLISEKETGLKVRSAVYPKYETRGDLAACVEIFREWLQDKVTDLEHEAGTKSAILNPSVGVILIAHSMGGFVAADTLFSVLENRPISPSPGTNLMFPLIHGVLAFDTPYNGLSRSMFAYGAFSQYQNISSILNIASTVSSLGAGATTSQIVARGAQQSPAWRRWQAIAARSGTYGAIVAGGVAAYMNRQQIAEGLSKVNKASISEGWSKVNKDNISQGLAYVSRDSIGEGFAWMGGHLKFVGALMKQAQLKTRLERLSQLKGVGVANLYTSLGENGYWTGGYFVPKRTFCAVPVEKETAMLFEEQANAKAANEIEAHCGMFRPEKNPGYEAMAETARDLVLKWLKVDPRKIVDDYEPPVLQRQRTMSEAQLFDDDGKVRNEERGKEEGLSEDEMQLKAILDSSQMPELEDGGVDEAALKAAAAVPLPLETETPLEGEAPAGWKSRVLKPFSGISMPSVPRPNVSMPSIPRAPSVSMPKFYIPGRGNKEKANTDGATAEAVSGPGKAQDSTTQPDATQIPLPVEELNEPLLTEERSPSVDSGVIVEVRELKGEAVATQEVQESGSTT
ncbi:hypothetical protein B0O99DRAFT_643584 [Bisporella sp. PMI_857]|nr:hypothetical protein B0O99DRAFT_643584 [Bisporella sp. PMI_857]